MRRIRLTVDKDTYTVTYARVQDTLPPVIVHPQNHPPSHPPMCTQRTNTHVSHDTEQTYTDTDTKHVHINLDVGDNRGTVKRKKKKKYIKTKRMDKRT